MKKYLLFFVFINCVAIAVAQTAGYQSCFTKETSSSLPKGWSLTTYQSEQTPSFILEEDSKGSYIAIRGNGDSLAVAYISTKLRLVPGTYKFKVLFSISDEVNPQRNLLFQCKASTHDGIFKFYKQEGMVEGRGTILVTGDKPCDTELRIFYRFNPLGEVKIRTISLLAAEEVKPRWVRFTCTQGQMNSSQMISVAAQAAKERTDLLLYPETVTQKSGDTSQSDSIMNLLSWLAQKHSMYISASVLLYDKSDGRTYNRGLLYDRKGVLVGIYDKIHPYSQEVNELGITPGRRTDVFDTDFGKIGIIICYDSWFTDITELLALKGAEVILFPVAGYYRSILPARSADNSVRFVVSTLGGKYGIFDTAGRDIEDPDKDSSIGTSGNTFRDIHTIHIDGIGLLSASLDLNCSPSPHYNGGKMFESPGGKRNRAEQVLYLDDLIKKEKERWWEK